MERKELASYPMKPLPLIGWLCAIPGSLVHALTIANVEPADRNPDVLLVVPTLGRRLSLLRGTLESIRRQTIPIDVVVVSPDQPEIHALCAEYGHTWLTDTGSQASAINSAIAEFGAKYFAVGWLNDDDALEPWTAHRVLDTLRAGDVVVAFGSCQYVGPNGSAIGLSRAGRLAPLILPWGPDLIPQPGMLVKAEAWHHVGGLDSSFRLAFDLDLLLRLKRLGRLRHVGCVVSRFMWHPESLTVDNRELNLQESERARRQALPECIRWMAPLWEKPAQGAVRIAAAGISWRAQSVRADT